MYCGDKLPALARRRNATNRMVAATTDVDVVALDTVVIIIVHG